MSKPLLEVADVEAGYGEALVLRGVSLTAFEAELVAINPRLVHLAITGYGPTGPDADKPGFDFIIQAAQISKAPTPSTMSADSRLKISAPGSG